MHTGLLKKAEGKSLEKCEQVNNLSITVYSAFTPAANKARSLLYFIKRVIYLSDKGDFRTSIQCFGATSSRICHPRKLSIPQKGHNPPRKNPKGSSTVGEGS